MSLIGTKKVAWTGPDGSPILIVMEAPGYEEEKDGVAAIGEAGDLLNQALGMIGLSRKEVKVVNLCNYRPNNNKWEHLEGSPQLKEGIADVKAYIETQRDKLKWIILLGEKPLQYIGGKPYGKVGNWRGSVIIPESDGVGYKYYSTFHPAYVLRDRSKFGIFTFDFRKVKRFIDKGYTKPLNDFWINPTGLDLEYALQEIEKYDEVSVDLEGVKGTSKILCCGFGLSSSRAICLVNPDWNGLGLSFNAALVRILENKRIRKVFQYGFGYDIECLRLNGINVESYTFDTMIAAHVLEPELPYGLDFLTSIHTDRSYYKDKGRSALPDDDKGWSPKAIERDGPIIWDYNCEDCVSTLEIKHKQWDELVQEKLLLMYDYKHSLIEVGQELSRPGMYVDIARKELLRIGIKQKWKYYQELLNAIAGYSVNAKGPKSLTQLLLKDFNLPERRNRDHSITFDEDTIISYLSFIQDKINGLKTDVAKEAWEYRLVACKCILLIRELRQFLSNYINIKYSDDGRVRSTYNLSAATETGRGSSHKWIDGTGNNAQTWPRAVLEFTDEEMVIIEKKLTEVKNAA